MAQIVHLKYIAYAMLNTVNVSAEVWQQYFYDRLGFRLTTMEQLKSPRFEKKVKNIAIHLYAIHYINIMVKDGSVSIKELMALPPKDTACILKTVRDLDDVHVLFYANPSLITEHMRNNFQGNLAVIKSRLDLEGSTNAPVKRANMNSMKVAELRQLAAKKNIVGRSKMKRAELLQALRR